MPHADWTALVHWSFWEQTYQHSWENRKTHSVTFCTPCFLLLQLSPVLYLSGVPGVAVQSLARPHIVFGGGTSSRSPRMEERRVLPWRRGLAAWSTGLSKEQSVNSP